jgi:hypothetical protein
MRLPRPAAGAKVVLLVTDNHASKLALRMAKALLRPRDELRVTTVVMSPESLSYGRKLTEEFCSNDTSGQLIPEVGGRDRWLVAAALKTPLLLHVNDQKLVHTAGFTHRCCVRAAARGTS